LKHLEHGTDRLDGDHSGAGGDQEAGQLAGPGGEVDDGRVLAEAELLGKPDHRLVGIAGPAALICVGGCGTAEPRARRLVDCH
jgi:hypothetical protein